MKVVQTTLLVGKPTANVTIEYEAHWPLDEFLSKANAIKKAAESKPVSTAITLPIDTSTGKQKTTGALRVGGQEEFRSAIQACIALVPDTKAQAAARTLMTQLQADHQQELQMGGSDKAENMAMIEQRMNSQMGGMFRGKLKNLSPESVLETVTIDQSAAKPGQHRPSGAASQLRDLLLPFSAATKVPEATIRYWFKLE